MWLNPTKYAFGVSTGKFLGFIISQRGIEANLEKIQAILELSPPWTTTEVQHLMDCIVALSRFVSKSVECCLSFLRPSVKLRASTRMKIVRTLFGNLKNIWLLLLSSLVHSLETPYFCIWPSLPPLPAWC